MIELQNAGSTEAIVLGSGRSSNMARVTELNVGQLIHIVVGVRIERLFVETAPVFRARVTGIETTGIDTGTLPQTIRRDHDPGKVDAVQAEAIPEHARFRTRHGNQDGEVEQHVHGNADDDVVKWKFR